MDGCHSYWSFVTWKSRCLYVFEISFYLRHTNVSMSFDGWQTMKCSTRPINDLLLGLWCGDRCGFGRLLFVRGRFATQCRWCTLVMLMMLLLSLSQFMVSGRGSATSGYARLNALLWFSSNWTVFRLIWFNTIGSCFRFMGANTGSVTVATAAKFTSTAKQKWSLKLALREKYTRILYAPLLLFLLAGLFNGFMSDWRW